MDDNYSVCSRIFEPKQDGGEVNREEEHLVRL